MAGNSSGAFAVKLLPNGNLIRMEATINNAFPGAVGTGGAGLLEELDWTGRVVWTYTLSNDQYLHHHDFQVLPNGNLVIQGVRVVTFSGETQYVVLHGIVRRDDIAPDNSVQSTNIADARVEFYAEGALTDAQKRGWLAKIFEKVRPL